MARSFGQKFLGGRAVIKDRQSPSEQMDQFMSLEAQAEVPGVFMVTMPSSPNSAQMEFWYGKKC